MHPTQRKTLSVVAGNDRPTLSKAQKAFNALINEIEKNRTRLANWESAIPPYQHRCVNELLPRIKEMHDLQSRMVHCLNQAHDRNGLTKTERCMIADRCGGEKV